MTIDFSVLMVILNFVLLVIILNALLYEPLRKFLSERQEKIQRDIDDASKSVDKANQLVIEKEEELKKAVTEALATKETIKKEAEIQADMILRDAKQHEAHIMQQAEDKIQALSKKARIELEASIGTLVANLAGQVLSEKIDGEKDKELINKLLSKRSG